MKKTIISLAVAAGMAASGAAFAEATVYGNVHLYIAQFDKDAGATGVDEDNNPVTPNIQDGAGTNGNFTMGSATSSLGVKGSEDLGNGVKAFYKAEYQFDSANAGGLTGRDQYAGLTGGMGTIKLGTMSSNYKQMGGTVDALYRTPAEGRGFIHTQSSLHGGAGTNRGRMTNAVQYASPKMGGMQLVVNTTASDSDDETVGVGFRYEAKAFSVYADMIDTAPRQNTHPIAGGGSIGLGGIGAGVTESATKIGGKFNADAFFVGAQFESAEDVVGYNYMHLNAGYMIDANNIITATYGTAEHANDTDLDTAGMALAYDHKMSKNTDVYVAYMDKSSDASPLEDSAMALGLRVKF